MDSVNKWYFDNHLTLNPSKSKVMLFKCNKGAHVGKLKIHLNHNPLEQVECIRYLGIQLDENLSWNSHVLEINKKIGYKVKLLGNLGKFLQKSLLEQLYKSTIQSTTDYAITVWGNTSEKNKNIIKRIQKRNFDYINYRGDDAN